MLSPALLQKMQSVSKPFNLKQQFKPSFFWFKFHLVRFCAKSKFWSKIPLNSEIILQAGLLYSTILCKNAEAIYAINSIYECKVTAYI